jgi:hypothetical protein
LNGDEFAAEAFPESGQNFRLGCDADDFNGFCAVA